MSVRNADYFVCDTETEAAARTSDAPGTLYYAKDTKRLCQRESDSVIRPLNKPVSIEYTGDGTTGLGVTGVGFKGSYIKIWVQKLVHGDTVKSYETSTHIIDDHVDGAVIKSDGNLQTLKTDAVKSFDDDGFTVSDRSIDSHPNKLGVIYNAMVWP